MEPTSHYSEEHPSIDSETCIRERLAALKESSDETGRENAEASNSGTTVTDIEKRLAALKGICHKDYAEANRRILTLKDSRSEEEQITDLMKQFAEEQEIHDAMSGYRLSAISDIEKRLAILKDSSTDIRQEQTATSKSDSSDIEAEENEDEAARILAAKFLEEASIDAKNSHFDVDNDELNNLDIPTPLDPSEVQEELPWCTICNEDADVRCVGCDGDLFCHGCYKECHEDDEEYRSHITKLYRANTKTE